MCVCVVSVEGIESSSSLARRQDSVGAGYGDPYVVYVLIFTCVAVGGMKADG